MKTTLPGFCTSLGRFFLFGLLFIFLIADLFAVVPIPERYLRGRSAAEARVNLLTAAQSLLGTPYRFGGIDRRGLDCSGFVYLSFREGLNIAVPRTSSAQHSWATRIDRAELQPGDLVFFVTVGTRVSHVGIYTGGGQFIHSASDGPRTGVIISHLTDGFWSRTFLGAGRVLPWNTETVREMHSSSSGSASRPDGSVSRGNRSLEGPTIREPVWGDSGIFVGFGASWTLGNITNGSSSLFRGFSAMASTGYKWDSFRVGLQLRPEWDNSIEVFRLPLTLVMGTDRLQVFGGPALTFGEANSVPEGRDQSYSAGSSILWELGVSAAFSPITIRRGAASLFGELAWQPYSNGSGNNFANNLRIATGVRYLWRL